MNEILDYMGNELEVENIVKQFTFDGSVKCGRESPVRRFKGENVLLL